MPLANDSAAIDVIDHAPNGGKGHEMENCNGSGKKGKQKKTGKSIFYQANVHSIRQIYHLPILLCQMVTNLKSRIS